MSGDAESLSAALGIELEKEEPFALDSPHFPIVFVEKSLILISPLPFLGMRSSISCLDRYRVVCSVLLSH